MRTPLPPDDPRHGTWNGYCNYACRCDPCKAAGAAYPRTKRTTPRGPLAEDDPRHGTVQAYGYWRCRCPSCVAAEQASAKAAKARRLAEMSAREDDPRHGKRSGYTYGCRCIPCTDAATEMSRAWRASRGRPKKPDRSWTIQVCATCDKLATPPFCEHRPTEWTGTPMGDRWTETVVVRARTKKRGLL